MWRAEGDAELYLYAPQDQADGFCEAKGEENSDLFLGYEWINKCNFKKGNSVNRGALRFDTGVWHHMEQRVKINTPGEKNGKFMLFQDGNLVINLDSINFVAEDDIQVRT